MACWIAPHLDCKLAMLTQCLRTVPQYGTCPTFQESGKGPCPTWLVVIGRMIPTLKQPSLEELVSCKPPGAAGLTPGIELNVALLWLMELVNHGMSTTAVNKSAFSNIPCQIQINLFIQTLTQMGKML